MNHASVGRPSAPAAGAGGAGAESTGDLPADHGYMYGKISLDVAYDKRKKLLIGAEDRATLRKAKSAFPDIKRECFVCGEHPVLLMSMTGPNSGKAVYLMYVGTNVDTNTVYVALRPPANSKTIGDYVWSRLGEALAECR